MARSVPTYLACGSLQVTDPLITCHSTVPVARLELVTSRGLPRIVLPAHLR